MFKGKIIITHGDRYYIYDEKPFSGFLNHDTALLVCELNTYNTYISTNDEGHIRRAIYTLTRKQSEITIVDENPGNKKALQHVFLRGLLSDNSHLFNKSVFKWYD
jgi:hypothetical protein